MCLFHTEIEPAACTCTVATIHASLLSLQQARDQDNCAQGQLSAGKIDGPTFCLLSRGVQSCPEW